MVATRGWEQREMGKYWPRGRKLYQMSKFWRSKGSMGMMVNNTVWYT